MSALLDEFYNLVPESKVGLYRAMADQAVQLGYKPKRDKTKHLSISFSSNRYRITILRFIYERGQATYRLKFFAAKKYSAVFDRSIKQTVERYDFKYTGCYGCGRCKGEKEGYQICYEDGRSYFRCGFELIEIIDLNESIKDEVLELLKIQTDYYENKAMVPVGA